MNISLIWYKLALSKRRAAGSVEIRLIKDTEVLVVPLEDKNFNFTDFERLTGR